MDLDSIADLVTLVKPLQTRGYSAEEIEGIFCGNFLRFLREHLR
jgi:microsomal dipeptidase-like Zn-dependent dipeptidase